MISVITVNYNSEDWFELLLHSLKKYTVHKYEVIVTDNSNTLKEDNERYKLLSSAELPRHWMGIEKALKETKGEYVLLLDCDAHIMRYGWDNDIVSLYNKDVNTRIIACKGDELYDNLPVKDKYKEVLKPFRPFAMFFKKDFIISNNLSFKPYSIEDSKIEKRNFKSELGNIYFDVGIHLCLKTIDLGYKVEPLSITKNGYKCRTMNNWGSCWNLNDIPTFYHHGFASRFSCTKDSCCGRKSDDFIKSKEDLFKEYYE